MSLFAIAIKSIRQRALASSLTSISVALGVALMIAVLIVNGILTRMFQQTGSGYDLIVGPKGSQLELVLNAIYRISPPIENLPWRYYKQLKDDAKIETAIPVALGDTTEQGNFPILGTTVEYFDVEYEVVNGKERKFRVRGDYPTGKWDAVIGSHVARQNNWDVGDEFRMVHGGQDDNVHEELFTIRGVLQATGTPNDRTVFVNLSGFFAIAGHEKPVDEAIAREADFFGETEEEVREFHKQELAEIKAHADHDHEHHDYATPDLQKEVTAILIRMRHDPENPTMSASLAIGFASQLREGFQAQAVNPIIPMRKLMDNLVKNIKLAVVALTILIIAVSGVGIFVSIYNSMSDRRHEIAIMRALGAGRDTVFWIIILESVSLCLIGGCLGILMGHGLVFLASPIIEFRSGLLIDPWYFEPMELIIIPGVMVMASLVGLVPALTAYRTDVADHLSR